MSENCQVDSKKPSKGPVAKENNIYETDSPSDSHAINGSDKNIEFNNTSSQFLKEQIFSYLTAHDKEDFDTVSTASAGSSSKHLSSKDMDLIQSKLNELKITASEYEKDEATIEKAYKKAVKELNGVMNSAYSTDTKLENIKDKFLSAIMETKRSTYELMRLRRHEEITNKEKALLKVELLKSEAIKMKLEQLCRELQKENKRIKEETKKLALMEQQKRDELSAKFDNAIEEISHKIEKPHMELIPVHSQENIDSDVSTSRNRSNNDKNYDESSEDYENYFKLRDKFYAFLQQYELREKHFNSVVKLKGLELKVLTAKMTAIYHSNKQANQQKKELLKKLEEARINENHLKDQIKQYIEKFNNIEETITKSSSIFSVFKSEIDTMSNKIRTLEQDKTALLTQKDTLTKSLKDSSDEVARMNAANESLNTKKVKLESICRVLQSQRNNAIQLIAKYKNVIGEEDYKAFCETSIIIPNTPNQATTNSNQQPQRSNANQASGNSPVANVKPGKHVTFVDKK